MTELRILRLVMLVLVFSGVKRKVRKVEEGV